MPETGRQAVCPSVRRLNLFRWLIKMPESSCGTAHCHIGTSAHSHKPFVEHFRAGSLCVERDARDALFGATLRPLGRAEK